MTQPKTGNNVPRSGSRHTNCKPMQVIGRQAAVSMSQQSRKAERAEIELLTRDFLDNGGEITKLESQQASTERKPAFNELPGEYVA